MSVKQCYFSSDSRWEMFKQPWNDAFAPLFSQLICYILWIGPCPCAATNQRPLIHRLNLIKSKINNFLDVWRFSDLNVFNLEMRRKFWIACILKALSMNIVQKVLNSLTKFVFLKTNSQQKELLNIHIIIVKFSSSN